MTNLENQNNANQLKKESDLKNKESSIVTNQDKVKEVASNKIEQGPINMATSMMSAAVDSGKNAITSISNTYNKAVGKTENIKPLIKNDKPLLNMEDEDLKLKKDSKEEEGNLTKAKSSNANVSENQNNKSK